MCLIVFRSIFVKATLGQQVPRERHIYENREAYNSLKTWGQLGKKLEVRNASRIHRTFCLDPKLFIRISWPTQFIDYSVNMPDYQSISSLYLCNRAFPTRTFTLQNGRSTARLPVYSWAIKVI